MARTFYSGETIRCTARDLTHSDSGSVTSGATGTMKLYDAGGAEVASGSVSNGGSGDDWFADLTAPTVSVDTEYTVKADVAKTGAVWRATEPITVRPF